VSASDGKRRIVELRDATIEDLPILFEYQREPEANRMAAFPAREREAFFTHWRTKILGQPGVTKRVILCDGEVAGDIGSWTARELPERELRLLGYWVGQKYWGRGIASQALALFLAQHERTRPLHAHVAVANLGSLRVLEKCGFRAEEDPTPDEGGVVELLMRLDAPKAQ
jgi:RimJ/RimL family protein N-acetyltransferase